MITGRQRSKSLLWLGMPKQKTHRGAAKRLQVTGSGKFKRRRAFVSHNLEHKSQDRKREKHGVDDVAKADVPRAKKLLGH